MMVISVQKASLFLTIAYILFTSFLFFLPNLYANSDLSNALQHYVQGRGHLLIAVRPLLLFLVSLFPSASTVTLSIISGIFYVFSIIIGYLLVKKLYDDRTAYYFPLLWLPNAYLTLNAFAPNADVPALFAGLLIMWATMEISPQSRNTHRTVVNIILLGLLSGLLGLMRENVLTAVLGTFLYLFFFSNKLMSLIYLAAALFPQMIWQVHAYTVYGMSLLTQIYTGISLASEYEYSPIKIARYFFYGVGPLTMFSLFLGLLYDRDRGRQMFIHFFLAPAITLALGWPAIFEPRLALIAFHAIIPPSTYGFSILCNSLTNHVLYGKRVGTLILVIIYLLNLLFNVWMAYTNNKNSFSPLWRFLYP